MKKLKRYKFSGHQTFAFRYGWLEKGVRGLLEEKDLFYRDDAIVRLGVGKNMVESIRHWCAVTQLIGEVAESERANSAKLKVTPIGHKLLAPNGWDPFLEDDATLWLIHWLLVSNPTIGTTWQIAFSTFQKPNFTRYELVDHLAAFAEKNGILINERSLSKDVDCFIHTYTPPRKTTKQNIMEESLNCPLQELNLLHVSPDGEIINFSVGAKPTLPSSVLGFALLNYFDTFQGGRNTLSVQECLYGKGSPGQAFKLDENNLIFHIEELDKITHSKITLDETAGLKQVYRRKEIDAIKLLNDYYNRGVSE